MKPLHRFLPFRWACILALTAGFFAPGCGPSEPTPPFETLSFPLPIDVDEQAVRSSLYMRAKAKLYDLPFEEFEDRVLDPREETFARLVRAVREWDLGLVAELVYGREPWEGETASLAVQTWRESFGEFEELTVLAQVALGGRGVFVVEWPGVPGVPPNALDRFAFVVRDLPDQRFRAAYVDRTEPLDFIVLYYFRKERRDPEAYRPVADPGLPLEYELVRHESEPVTWGFAGGGAVGSGGIADEAGGLYARAMKDFEAGNWDEFLSILSPIRRQGAEKWMQRTSAAEREKIREKSRNAGWSVRHVLDADPVVILVSARSPNGEDAQTMRWEYLRRVPDSEGLRLAARNPSDPFEQLFGRYVAGELPQFESRLHRAAEKAPLAAAD